MPPPVSERTPALILRAVDFGESDRILHLLVPDGGRLTAIAKGARRSTRRFAGTLDLFNQLTVQLHRRRGLAMSRLDGAVLVRHYAPLRSDPVRFALGCTLLELLDRLAPEGGASRDTRRLFRFAVEALETLSAHRPDATLRTILELRALDALGLRPELRRCVACGREPEGQREVSFHVADGGLVCGACAARRSGLFPVSLGALRSLERSLALPVAQLGRIALSPGALADARRLVERFERFHVGVELQSRRFLERMLPARSTATGNRPAVTV